jgi:hypothetical protein
MDPPNESGDDERWIKNPAQPCHPCVQTIFSIIAIPATVIASDHRERGNPEETS